MNQNDNNAKDFVEQIIDAKTVDELSHILQNCDITEEDEVVISAIEADKSDEFIETLIKAGAPVGIVEYRKEPDRIGETSVQHYAFRHGRYNIAEKIADLCVRENINISEALSYCSSECLDDFFYNYNFERRSIGRSLYIIEAALDNEKMSKSVLAKIINQAKFKMTTMTKPYRGGQPVDNDVSLHKVIAHPNMDSDLDNLLINRFENPFDRKVLRGFINLYRGELEKNKSTNTYNTALEEARKKLNKAKMSVSGVAMADKIAEKQISGEEKRVITPNVGKDIRQQIMKDIKNNVK